jgi:diaminohydroxyphosphoribosylaminopyrimidine deaminase/5-amino-6-(5-phosphoribosylamino)uracil reductase
MTAAPSGRHSDVELIMAAIDAARLHHPHPNPKVGAVVVGADGDVLAISAHSGPGTPHAEAAVLAAAGDAASGGTLVVTLEPCAHHGRTPPCVDSVLASGVRRVVVGAIDPDRQVAGEGVHRLRAAGIDVQVGVPGVDAEELDPGYFHHRRTGRPFVTLKLATTLDGQVAGADGTSRWITSLEARHDAHLLRASSDAVLVGAGTALADDPELTVRIEAYDGPQPRPVVVTGRRGLPPDLALLGRDPIILAPRPVDLPGHVAVVPDAAGELVDPTAALSELGRLGIVDLLVEGGPTLAGSLWSAGLVDRLVIYLGARLAGGVGRPAFDGSLTTLADARPIRITSVTRVGPDVRVEASPT